MLGQMMHRPLSIIEILRFGAETHKTSEIVSVRTEGDIHRYLTQRLTDAWSTGPCAAKTWLQAGRSHRNPCVERVSTFRTLLRHCGHWRSVSHNQPAPERQQMIYITKHAQDKVLCVDLTFVPLVEALAEHFPADMTYILMTDKRTCPGQD